MRQDEYIVNAWDLSTKELNMFSRRWWKIEGLFYRRWRDWAHMIERFRWINMKEILNFFCSNQDYRLEEKSWNKAKNKKTIKILGELITFGKCCIWSVEQSLKLPIISDNQITVYNWIQSVSNLRNWNFLVFDEL